MTLTKICLSILLSFLFIFVSFKNCENSKYRKTLLLSTVKTIPFVLISQYAIFDEKVNIPFTLQFEVVQPSDVFKITM